MSNLPKHDEHDEPSVDLTYRYRPLGAAADERASVTIRCHDCGDVHPGDYSHESQYGAGAIYAVVCPVDYLTSYYTSEAICLFKDALGLAANVDQTGDSK